MKNKSWSWNLEVDFDALEIACEEVLSHPSFFWELEVIKEKKAGVVWRLMDRGRKWDYGEVFIYKDMKRGWSYIEFSGLGFKRGISDDVWVNRLEGFNFIINHFISSMLQRLQLPEFETEQEESNDLSIPEPPMGMEILHSQCWDWVNREKERDRGGYFHDLCVEKYGYEEPKSSRNVHINKYIYPIIDNMIKLYKLQNGNDIPDMERYSTWLVNNAQNKKVTYYAFERRLKEFEKAKK